MESSDLLEVVMCWGGSPQGTELFKPGQTVRVGDDKDASFSLPRSVLTEGFTLAEGDESGWVIQLPAQHPARVLRRSAEGEYDAVDTATLLSDAAGNRRLKLEAGLTVDIEVGDFSFHLRSAGAVEKVAALTPVDWRVGRFFLGSAVVHAIILVAFYFQPPGATAISTDLTQRDIEYIQFTMTAAAEMLPEPEPSTPTDIGPSGAATNEGRPMEGDEGAAGAEDEARNTGGNIRVRGDSTERQIPVTGSTVRDMHILSAIATAAQSITDISSPFGAEDAEGWADADAYGLPNAADGFSRGQWGFGMLGVGRGSCPPGAECGQGTIGVGDLDTIGANGGCTRAVFDRLAAAFGRAGAMDRCSGTARHVSNSTLQRDGGRVPPPVSVGNATTTGGLRPEQVRRVVRRNIGQVRHCYEQALQGQPDLDGRVSVQFSIAPTGAVQSSQLTGSSVSNNRMEGCVVQAVRRWPFPQSNGMTIVTYPFMFRAPGS